MVKNIDLSDALLVHMQKEVDRIFYGMNDFEFVCRKLNIKLAEKAEDYRNYPVNAVDRIFSNYEDTVYLKNIEGVIPPAGRKLLVTIHYDKNYYEVICDAIVAHRNEERFDLINCRVQHSLLPDNRYDKQTVWKLLNQIEKQQDMPDQHLFAVRKIVDVATHTDKKKGASYWVIADNPDEIKEAFYSCRIHSVELLADADAPKTKTLQYYKGESSRPFEKQSYGYAFSDSLFVYGYKLFMSVNEDEKTVIFFNTRTDISYTRDGDSYNGFGYDEDEITYCIRAEKKFSTRYELEKYMERFISGCEKNGIKTEREENQLILSGIGLKMSELNGLLEAKLKETY